MERWVLLIVRKLLVAGLLLIAMIMATGCSDGDEDYPAEGVASSGSVQSAQPAAPAPAPTNSTDGPATTADGGTACTANETFLADKNFTYTAYRCATDQQYRAMGDEILARLASTHGVLFGKEPEVDFDLDFYFDYEFASDEEVPLVNYAVTGNQLGPATQESVPPELRDLQNDQAGHEALWNQVIRLIPSQLRSGIVEFVVFAHDETVGYVNQNLYDDEVSSDWIYAINILDAESELERNGTIIHEIAHIIVLQASQVTPYVVKADCAWLFFDEGCSKSDSYVQRFYERFWVDIYDEVQGYDGDAERLESFYQARTDQFVTEYAATSMIEDLAETFAYFVLQPTPTAGTVKDQKILFYYDDPELVSLRVEILSRLEAMIKESH